MTVRIGTSELGDGAPVSVIAEIGHNHNGSVDTAIQLIDVAADAGAHAVKFQKRTPSISTPEHMKNTQGDTPWGMMTYLEYRNRVEFSREQYVEIGDYATYRGLDWFAPPSDEPSVDFLENLNVSAHKVASASASASAPASASVTDIEMLRVVAATGKPIILSTGMSTLDQIDRAVGVLGTERLVILHATSTYPLPAEEANLRTITLDRSMWGSDHAASLDPQGFEHLVRDIRVIGEAMGDGVKRISPGELAPLAKLRRVPA